MLRSEKLLISELVLSGALLVSGLVDVNGPTTNQWTGIKIITAGYLLLEGGINGARRVLAEEERVAQKLRRIAQTESESLPLAQKK